MLRYGQDNRFSASSTLLYCLGDEANDILTTTGGTDEGLRYCCDKATRFQQPGESAEQFIAELYVLAEECEYGGLKDQMIRDRIVVGIRDAKLSQRMQMDSTLDLAKAKTTLRQAEAVQEQQSVLKPPAAVEFVKEVRGARGRRQRSVPQKPSQRCMRCGRAGKHQRTDCPARNATCHYCHKEGHFASQCLSKQAADVQINVVQDTKPKLLSQHTEQSDEDVYLTEVYMVDSRERCWTADVLVGRTEVNFKLDTGAEVTTISERVYETLADLMPLEQTSLTLFGPGRTPLHVIGQFSSMFTYNGRTSQHTVFVIKGLRNNLLGFCSVVQDCSLFRTMTMLIACLYKHVYHYKSSVFGHTLSTLAIYYILATRMATLARLRSIGEFNSEAGHSIKSYLERMEIYFQANNIPEDKRAAVFLSALGETTYDLLRSLCSPTLPSAKTYDELANLLKKHLEPEPLIIAIPRSLAGRHHQRSSRLRLTQ